MIINDQPTYKVDAEYNKNGWLVITVFKRGHSNDFNWDHKTFHQTHKERLWKLF